MRFLQILAALWALTITTSATSDGLTDSVTWDPYSASVNGSRLFIFSGEFHYQRMPVPEMWLDIFQKFRANGFNAISVYFFWSYHSPSKGAYDFDTSGKNVQRMLNYAKQAGLYVIARSGPYCNAETNGGGLALWGSDGSFGNLRTSDEKYHQAWLPWIAKIGKILADNEITKGGPIILNQVENELQETVHSATNTLVIYMEQLKSAFRAAGITVPFTHNEKGQRGQSWSTDYQNVGGAVNMYGLDSYPGGMSCTNLNKGFNVVRNYYQWFSNYSYTQPNHFPEFEGGYFTPWGGSFYDDCLAEHDSAFADVFYKNNIGQRTTIQNLYMAWGGTNWGHSAAPVVYTSYDYSAPLSETREITDKLYQTKLLGLFTRVSVDLLKTVMVGNGTGWTVSSPAIWTWQLSNPDTKAGFYVVQHSSTPSRVSDTFTIMLSTTQGSISVPDVNLNGRQSKIIVTDYKFGRHLLYSTAEVLTYGIFNVDVLVLYLQVGQIGQFAFKDAPADLTYMVYGSTNLITRTTDGRKDFIYTQGAGQTVVKFSDGTLLYLLDLQSALQFWAPPTNPSPAVSPKDTFFVLGPYLVRSATLGHGVVQISGDSNRTSAIEVYTGHASTTTIVWNGKWLTTTKTPYGSLVAQIPGAEMRSVSLPVLSNWRSGNSLPEIDPSYDDSRWTICNKTSTQSPVPPVTLPVLFSSDYGFYTGAKIYRGYFDGTGATSVILTTSGGLAFGFNAWLNGILIGGDPGNASLTTITSTLRIPSGLLKNSRNVLTVVVDYHGHDQTSTAKGIASPRGILGAALSTGSFSIWKIMGNAGGAVGNIDPVRGPMNEGGLYGERMGWPLPEYDSSRLPITKSPMDGLTTSGIQFHVTTFELAIDADLDAPLGIELSASPGTIARVMIWVNGYQYGKYIPHIGPQTRFPIPPGIINNRGKNTLALSLWAQTDQGAKLAGVKLINYGMYQTDFGFSRDWRSLQPAWNATREMYK